MRFTVTVEMKGRWVPHFLGLLDAMERYGTLGMSRKVAIYADGDGDFQPKFKWATDFDPAEPIDDVGGNVLFDAG